MCCELKSKYQPQLKLNQFCQRSRELQQDHLAQSLIPFDAPSGLIACKALGDGNCLYYATPLSLRGTTESSIVLHMLTAIEWFENAHY